MCIMQRITTIYNIPIYSYGTSIAIGTLLYAYALHRDIRVPQYISHSQLDTMMTWTLMAALVGGKLLGSAMYLLTHQIALHEAIWYGGLSITGTVVAAFITLGYAIYHYGLHPYAVLDLFALYAPLVHAAGRIGCLLAGCCHGSITHSWYAITYTDPESWAPLWTPLHPVQLYQAIWHLSAFILLYYVVNNMRNGMLTGAYMITFALARGLFEGLRADYTPLIFGLSYTHILTCSIFICGVGILLQAGYHDNITA